MRTKDPRLMTKIATLYGSGMNIKDISAQTGVTRGTVRGYIRSPEMQGAVEVVQEGMVEVLGDAVDFIKDNMRAKPPEGVDGKTLAKFLMSQMHLAELLIDKLGSKLIGQVATGEVSKNTPKTPEQLASVKKQLEALGWKAPAIPEETPEVTIEAKVVEESKPTEIAQKDEKGTNIS